MGKRDEKEVKDMRCPICMCDLYENSFDIKQVFTVAVLDDLVTRNLFDSVVLMKKCKDHLFHLECLEM